MDELTKWLTENVKPGTDIQAGLKLVPGNPMESVKTKEEALALIEKHPLFRAGLDYHTTTKIEKHDAKFAEEKLPGLLKAEAERIRKELNPEEDPKDKRIRELEEQNKARDAKEKQNELKAALRAKAGELKFDSALAEDYFLYGDQAAAKLEAAAKKFQAEVDARVDQITKERFGNTPPRSGDRTPAKTMKREAFVQLNPQAQMDFVRKEGGTVVD